MHPGAIAERFHERDAVVMHGSGERLTYGELDRRSNRLAHLFRAWGLGPGDRIAVLLPNHLRYFEVCWAAQRSGLYFVPVNWHLSAAEVAYIVADCGASALVTTAALAQDVLSGADLGGVRHVVVLDGEPPAGLPGAITYDVAVDGLPFTPVADQQEGAWMFYSSGTTGRPKGIKPDGIGAPLGTTTALDSILRGTFGYDDSVRYLVPAPLYHAAPLGWSMSAHRVGGTVVVLERFDAAECLAAIENHGITHAQFVPTHFVRLLKLDTETRAHADLSSLRVVVHAAAPCPPDVKDAVLDWFGDIVTEFYSGSEGVGFCMITGPEWRRKRGSVGKPTLGVPHILGEDGSELPAGEIGEIWFETPLRFEYHNAPDKNDAAWNDRGWATFGDLGHLDEEGYLFIADRRTDLVISGGVNIYPREVEDELVMHPDVADVACLGVADDELGQILVAVVQPSEPGAEPEVLEACLQDWVEQRLARFKHPRRWYVVDEVPRLPTGKILRRELADRLAIG